MGRASDAKVQAHRQGYRSPAKDGFDAIMFGKERMAAIGVHDVSGELSAQKASPWTTFNTSWTS
jgi:hypothetical protein